MNAFEAAYFLIAMIVFCGTWWLMLDTFSTPKSGLVMRLVLMSTFGVAVAAICGILWPLTLLGFVLIAAVSGG